MAMPRAASEKDVAGVRKVAEGSGDKLPPIAVSASLPTVTNIGGGLRSALGVFVGWALVLFWSLKGGCVRHFRWWVQSSAPHVSTNDRHEGLSVLPWMPCLKLQALRIP